LKTKTKTAAISWKSLIVAIIVAFFLNIFISAAAGIEPQKNIAWTVFWIYLSIEAWKFWKWKALLPYPLFLVLTIISLPVVAATGSNYLSWTHISVGLFLNIGGLVTFFLLLRRTQNRTKRDKQVVGDTGIAFNKPTVKTFPKKTTVKKPSPQPKNEDSKMKEKNTVKTNNNELYKQVWREIEENKTDVGLWANCFSTCEGDENKTKALYVNERVLDLKENLQKQIIDQVRKLKKQKNDKERKAKKQAEDEMKRKLNSQDKAKRMSIFEGRTDNIEIFINTLNDMPTFFPNILDQFGYKLVHSKDKEELWSIYFPNGTGVRRVYNLYDLRTEIRKIVVKEDKKTWKCDCGAETEIAFSNCSRCQKFKPQESRWG